jgi:hypothetical protein
MVREPEPFARLKAVIASGDPQFRRLLELVLGAMNFGPLTVIDLSERGSPLGDDDGGPGILFLDFDHDRSAAQRYLASRRVSPAPPFLVLVSSGRGAETIATLRWARCATLLVTPITIPKVGEAAWAALDASGDAAP